MKKISNLKTQFIIEFILLLTSRRKVLEKMLATMEIPHFAQPR